MASKGGSKYVICFCLLSFEPRICGGKPSRESLAAAYINRLAFASLSLGFGCSYYFQLRTTALKAYCAIWVRRYNFRHQAFPRVSPRESTQRRKVELWARNVREFCLNVDFHVTFRDLLHAVKLRHGTDGFTSRPKEGVLRIFSP
jgi:hypothetical protein